MNVVLVGLPPLTALGIETALAASAGPVRIDQVKVPEKVICLARDGQVDLVIVDPHQPTLSDGLKFCRALKEVDPPPYLMALSCLSDRQAIMYCLLAGIDSFVSRDQGPDRFASAVRSTLVGNREWLLGSPEDRPADLTDLDGLTPREQEVLWMLRERHTNQQIGSALSISANTAKNHVAAILRKLGLRRRSDLLTGTGVGAG